MRIAVDAMGGDHAPREIVRGAVAGLCHLNSDSQIVLVGRREAVEPELAACNGWQDRVVVEHADQVIGMGDPPVESIRQKRRSSIARMVALAGDKQVDALISAGNTGACAAACQLKLRLLPGVSRPGIAVVIPTFGGPLVICDVGANVAPRPRHLYEYTLMSSVYAAKLLGIEAPRVGLLSIGSEDVKGNELVRGARELIRADTRINLTGNVEGRDLFEGKIDVAICDGFVGNVVLKLVEGLAEGLFNTIRKEIAEANADLAESFKPVIQTVWAKHDYNEYGGAPLLGVDGLCVICHGSSDARAIKNAIRVVEHLHRQNLNPAIVERMQSRS